MFDVAIVGSGPAGSSCAAFCANAGLRTLLLEREIFPREKVCGDCLNPACWPILRRLQLMERVRTLPHGVLDRVEFIGIGGRTLAVTLPAGDEAEIAVKRSLFDQLIMRRARELGATICEGSTVTALTASGRGKRELDVHGGGRDLRVTSAGRGRWPELDRCPALQPASTRHERAHCAANSSPVATGLRKSRRSPIPAGRIFRAGSGRGWRTESLPGQRAPQDGGFAFLGGSALRNFARALLAHDHAADSRTDRRCSSIAFPCRRCSAGGGAVYRRRYLLRAWLRRAGCECDYCATERAGCSRNCSRLLRRACESLSWPALDQSAGASRGVISATGVLHLGGGEIPTGHSSVFDREDRAVIQLGSRGKRQGEAVYKPPLFLVGGL